MTKTVLAKIVLIEAVLLASCIATAAQTKRGWLAGTWEGTGYQTDTDSTWTMRLDARRGRFAIEYPSLECGGVWRLVGLTRWRATFRETITRGADRCTPNGNVTVLRLGGGQLLYLYANRGTSRITASAVLNRKRR